LLAHRRGHIVYYVVEFTTIILTLNKFSFINLIKLDHHRREIMLQKLNVVDDSCESILVLKRKADILRISMTSQFINNTVIFLLTCVK